MTFEGNTVIQAGASWKVWRWLALAGCVAVAVMLCHPQDAAARRRGGSSLFVNTPYGIIPKSVMYGQYMSPQQLQHQQAAEQKAMKKMQSAYNKRMGITTPKTSKKKSNSNN
ncbi:MAG TPA: hypothetical protein VIK18_21350 [Pirellulales bacterium]